MSTDPRFFTEEANKIERPLLPRVRSRCSLGNLGVEGNQQGMSGNSVRLVELSLNSLYIHTIYLPVGEDCARADARAPILKTKVHIDISEFKFQLSPPDDSPCHAYHMSRFLLDSQSKM